MNISAQICAMRIFTQIHDVTYNDSERGMIMATTKASQRAVNKYMRENYDRINLTVEKGKKDAIKAHAESKGESVNGFINRAINETMEREREG